MAETAKALNYNEFADFLILGLLVISHLSN